MLDMVRKGLKTHFGEEQNESSMSKSNRRSSIFGLFTSSRKRRSFATQDMSSLCLQSSSTSICSAMGDVPPLPKKVKKVTDINRISSRRQLVVLSIPNRNKEALGSTYSPPVTQESSTPITQQSIFGKSPMGESERPVNEYDDNERNKATTAQNKASVFFAAVCVLREVVATSDFSPICSAIVCEISSKGTPSSSFSRVVLQSIDDNVKSHLKRELKFSKKVIVTKSSGFRGSDYLIFVIKPTQEGILPDLRFIYYNIVQAAMENSDITSIFIPFLFTWLEPDLVANTAFAAIRMAFTLKGFGMLKRLYIGGIGETGNCYDRYINEFNKILQEISPDHAMSFTIDEKRSH